MLKLDIREYYALDESERVLTWREEELARAGYDEILAALAAAHGGIDLHRAVDLARRGCPPKLALRILV